MKIDEPNTKGQLMTHSLTDEIIRYLSSDHIADGMRAAADWQLEQVVYAWEDAFQSDLEHGVRSLNDKAAKELAAKYPKIFAFGEVLAAMQINNNNNRRTTND